MSVASRSLNSNHQQFHTLTDVLVHAATRHPESGLYVASPDLPEHDAVFFSYPTVLDRARRILGGLRERIRDAGSNVVLLLEDPAEFIPAFWACVLGGYVPCPVKPIRNNPKQSAAHLAYLHQLLDGPLFVCSNLPDADPTPTIALATAEHLACHAPGDYVSNEDPDALCLLMLTSGSTGNSKAVALTHANILAAMAGKIRIRQLTATDVFLNWIAFDHVAALLEAHIAPACVGAVQLHVQPARILADPLLYLRLIARFRVTTSFSPNFLLAHINTALGTRSPMAPLELDLSCVRHIVSGGEAIVVETGRRFLESLAPYGLSPGALWPAFGMTETCAGCVYSTEFPTVETDREFASLGVAVDEVQMRIANEQGLVAPNGAPGELQFRGPIVFKQYLNNPDATAAAFTPDGWFRSGDIGTLKDDRLILVGRDKDCIIVSGVNYYNQELEKALESLQGVERSYVAAFPTRPTGAQTEQLVVMFATTLPWSAEDQLYRLVTAIRNSTIMLWGFRPAMILPLPKAAFPKTSLGKIQRSLLRKQLEADELSAHQARIAAIAERQCGAHTPPEGAVERALVEVFSRIFQIDAASVSTGASFFDLGGTSIDLLKLTKELEQRFGMDAALPIILQNPTVSGLSARIIIGNARADRQYSPIVPLQTTGKKTPLFCVHPGNGEILIMVNLAKYFSNERPFYALRPRGFNENEDCFETFDEMLEAYVKAILECQPQGPYALAGYSYGGPVAFELAKKLQERGEIVAFLGCIDGAICHPEPPLDAIGVITGLAVLLELISWKQAKEAADQLRHMPVGYDQCEHVLRLASSRRRAELNLDARKFNAWTRVALAVENIMLSHTTAGRLEHMAIFYTTPTTAADHVWYERIERWNKFVCTPKFINVPGNHYTLMAPKHVATFQDILRTELDLALDGR